MEAFVEIRNQFIIPCIETRHVKIAIPTLEESCLEEGESTRKGHEVDRASKSYRLNILS
jgi:hypothetical protein